MYQITLRGARESCGFSVDEVAGFCGVTVEDLKRYEEDTRGMPFDTAKKVKRLLGVNIGQIFVGLESDYA